jgi:aspartate aminotransferase-like enzyme
LRNRPTLLLVDSVSGLGGVEMRQDEWGVDVVVSASQKALMCPPGLGLASVSQKAWQIVNREDGLPRFYFDFRKYRSEIEEGATPYTSAVSLILGLNEALYMIHDEGIPEVLARHRRISSALRAGCAARGCPSDGVVPSPPRRTRDRRTASKVCTGRDSPRSNRAERQRSSSQKALLGMTGLCGGFCSGLHDR